MEQVKEFFKSPKKTAILGLFGSIIFLIINVGYSIPYILQVLINNIKIVGLIIYFIIVLNRIYKKTGNIKVANYILIITFIIDIIIKAIRGISFASVLTWGIIIQNIVSLIVSIIVVLFFFNALLKKPNFVSNKVFAIAMIIPIIISIISVIISKSSLLIIVMSLVIYICQLAILPYFYNYYEL